MSLKAGRVGVNPADVDPISGHISPDASDSYTKSQADDKFLSKSDASSTYETKSDAAALQPKTLAVPISMLEGSQLVPKTTVESIFGTMNNAMTNSELTEMVTVKESVCTSIVEGATVNNSNMGNHLVKMGNVVTLHLSLSAVTVAAWVNIAKIPRGFIPKYISRLINLDNNKTVQITEGGYIQSSVALTNEYFDICGTWITE